MTDNVETSITITHKPNSQHIVVKASSGRKLLEVDAPPKVALRALADYLRWWANKDDGRVRE
jgi:hypothetical protein